MRAPYFRNDCGGVGCWIYREQQHTARRAALDELAAEGQRLGLGY